MTGQATICAYRPRHIPGEPGIWLLIVWDLAVFTALFVNFLFSRGQAPEIYAKSAESLDQTLGVLNTLLMLTSSWAVAQGVACARGLRLIVARRLFLAAFLCGAGFAVVKYFEYSAKIRIGVTASTNEFFTFYYVLTGIHLLHVVVGMGALLLMRSWVERAGQERERLMVESGALFWHVVDLIWIVLFALLYLIR